MKKSKVGIDFKKVDYARGLAKRIADDVQQFVEQYTTVAVERTLARLMGIDNVDGNDVPLPNVVVDSIQAKGALSRGVLFFLANAVAATGDTPQRLATSRVSHSCRRRSARGSLPPTLARVWIGLRRGAPGAKSTFGRSGRDPGLTFTSSWPPGTSTRMWCRRRPARGRALISSR